ncbi:PAQR family membrane homeostasis protein TrhA [Azospirillum sp.]|uniref:PAQR family membrane homeostasis protein TrhA n=1 Tax=Azospirillum sp. TaxID=34012 RepID=UPI003D7072C8
MRALRERRVDLTIQTSGLAASIVAGAILITWTVQAGSAGAAVAVGVYGASLVAMFACSTLYAAATAPRRKAVLRVFDHSAIFLLIAGTYTPFCALVVGGWRGFGLLAAIWLVAAAGILLKILFRHRPEAVTVALYVALGWAGVVQLDAVIERLSPGALTLLMAGGVIYTAGVPVHLRDSIPYNQAIWHGCVFAAAACHYAAVVLVLSAA